jgi:hypothetical protein
VSEDRKIDEDECEYIDLECNEHMPSGLYIPVHKSKKAKRESVRILESRETPKSGKYHVLAADIGLDSSRSVRPMSLVRQPPSLQCRTNNIKMLHKKRTRAASDKL